MDAFEEIVAGLFRQEGYWTRQSYKVNLTKEERQRIGKPSMPRPEIDVLAYKPAQNTLLWIECKSFLDSSGVAMLSSGYVGDAAITDKPFWLFSNDPYREIVSDKLREQCVVEGLSLPNTTLQYCLVAGRVKNEESRRQIQDQFQRNGWLFYDEIWIREGLKKLAKLGYENDVAIIVTKLLERKR